MALTQGNQILWSDIKQVMTNINAARSKMGYSTTTLQGLIDGTVPQPAQSTTISTLYNQLKECTGRSVVSGNSTVTANLTNAAPPSVGDLITLKQLAAINTASSTIQTLNFAFFSGCFGFSQFSFSFGYFGSGFGYWA